MKTIIAIIILLFLAWVFVVVPQRRKTRAHEAMQDDVGLDDEIITAGGIHGVVREVEEDGDLLHVEIAPGTIVRLDRRAVAAVAEEVDEPAPPPKPQTKPS